jgi:N-acetylmuramoyl-L-alanine amidase
MAKKIYLSPANHDGQNVCRYNNKKCRETIHSRQIALQAGKYLKHNGFSVKVRKTMTGTTIKSIIGSATMAKAVAEANKWGADLYIPIHTNASSDSSVSGVMFMTLNKSASKYKKAYDKIGKTIQKEYAAALKAAGYKAKSAKWVARPDLYEITQPNALTFYLEMGFHTNLKPDVTYFIHKDSYTFAGKAIAKGICAYYGVTFKDTDKTEPIPDTPSEPTESPETGETGDSEQVFDNEENEAGNESERPGIDEAIGQGLGLIILGILAAVVALLFV